MKNANNIIKNFETFNFPLFSNIIYIIGIQNKDEFIPFYVGESTRHIGRLGDYIKPNFNATTDFKVGEAIKYIYKKGFKIVFKFKISKNYKRDERVYIREIKKLGYTLINNHLGYNPKTNSAKIQRKKIQEFVQENILSKL